MGNVFTTKFLLIITGVLILSSTFSYTFLAPKKTSATMNVDSLPLAFTSAEPQPANEDVLIDQALEFSLNGAYDESFPILKELAGQENIRAKLYLAVAYYHGQGVQKNKQQAKTLFLELQDKNYEAGIVNTYLNLIAYSEH